jgi:hypothetical protein
MRKTGSLAVALIILFAWVAAANAALHIEKIAFRAAKFGPLRADHVYSVGERIHLSMDLTGWARDTGGRLDVELYATVTHEGGAVLLPRTRMFAMQEASPYKEPRLAVAFRLSTGDDPQAGKYTITLDAEDRVASSKAQERVDFVQAPLKPALLNLDVTADKKGEIPLPWIVPKGMRAYVQLDLSDVSQNKDHEIDIRLDLLVRDEQKKMVGESVLLNSKTRLDEKMKLIPADATLSFNIPGRLEYEFVLTDQIAGRKVSAVLPIQVLE